tara:strand:- start:207 stop:683 length:477 start_codon:yes stop_codon:yes gene_type:complete
MKDKLIGTVLKLGAENGMGDKPMGRLSGGKSRALQANSRQDMVGVAQDGNLDHQGPSKEAQMGAKVATEGLKVAAKASGVGTVPMLAAEALGLDKVIENQIAGKLDGLQKGDVMSMVGGVPGIGGWKAGRTPAPAQIMGGKGPSMSKPGLMPPMMGGA